MSDYSTSIVDIQATPEEAPALARKVVADLARREIIVPELSDCILSDDHGHAPGANWPSACVKVVYDLRSMRCNGLEVICERTVAHTGGNGVELRCPSCGARFEPVEYLDLVGEWFNGDEAVELACPQCGHTLPLARWDGPWVFGLGNLAFQFWNWPELRQDFIDSVTALLGHQVRVARCRI